MQGQSGKAAERQRDEKTLALKRADGSVLLARIVVADGFFAKGLGLMGRKGLPAGEGLYLKGCSGVHTCFMRFALDLIYVDADLKVLKVVSGLKPWRASMCRGARGVFESYAGTFAAAKLALGEKLALA